MDSTFFMRKCVMKKIIKFIKSLLIIILSLLVISIVGTFVFHKVKGNKELKMLKEEGYYNLVSVGDYSLNVIDFGNKNGKHTIVGMAGLGSGDFSISMRQTTACLENDNRIVFVDRAGYGLSDDTKNEMTLEYIVEDYRKALKNANIKAPYILMPHSIGGAYATYWVSKYPDEIEGIAFIDGTQLTEEAFEGEEYDDMVKGSSNLENLLAKMGFARYVFKNYFYRYPDNYSDKEQKIADALMQQTLGTYAISSETNFMSENSKKAFNEIVSNNVPKLYICSSFGYDSKESIEDWNKWVNRQREKNNLKFPSESEKYDDNSEILKNALNNFEEARKNIIYPYAEKMGNCKVVLLGGDHMIYEQKPIETGEIIKSFIDKLDN